MKSRLNKSESERDFGIYSRANEILADIEAMGENQIPSCPMFFACAESFACMRGMSVMDRMEDGIGGVGEWSLCPGGIGGACNTMPPGHDLGDVAGVRCLGKR